MGYRGNNEFDQFEMAMRRFEAQLKNLFQSPKLFMYVAGVIALVVGLFTSFYTVEPDEEAVVLRFGQYSSTHPPGLHLKIPFGVDRAIKVKTKLVLQEEFGFRTKSVRGQRTSYSSKQFDEESLMLTGDLNVADVEWITQFQISDPKKFLFHTRNPIVNIRDVSEAVMRRVVGDRLVNDVLTVGRAEIASEAGTLIQEIADKYDMGVRVVSIKLQDVNPPDSVKPSFNEVNEAKQEQEQAINQAEKRYNKVIPEARGKAEERVAKAEGVATELINRAKGDAKRFDLVLREYRRAPRVTKDRLYIETMERLMQRLDDFTIVDKGVEGLLPIFTPGAKASAGAKGVNRAQ